MDFYWHYSGKETVDAHGKENFCRAINVAKQVFNTLTEYIQVWIWISWIFEDFIYLGTMSTKSISISEQSIMGCDIRISLYILTYAKKIITSIRFFMIYVQDNFYYLGSNANWIITRINEITKRYDYYVIIHAWRYLKSFDVFWQSLFVLF